MKYYNKICEEICSLSSLRSKLIQCPILLGSRIESKQKNKVIRCVEGQLVILLNYLVEVKGMKQSKLDLWKLPLNIFDLSLYYSSISIFDNNRKMYLAGKICSESYRKLQLMASISSQTTSRGRQTSLVGGWKVRGSWDRWL